MQNIIFENKRKQSHIEVTYLVVPYNPDNGKWYVALDFATKDSALDFLYKSQKKCSNLEWQMFKQEIETTITKVSDTTGILDDMVEDVDVDSNYIYAKIPKDKVNPPNFKHKSELRKWLLDNLK